MISKYRRNNYSRWMAPRIVTCMYLLILLSEFPCASSAGACKSWCNNNGNSWDAKCNWPDTCDTCPECASDVKNKAQMTTKKSGTGTGTCKANCERNSKGWDVKCKW